MNFRIPRNESLRPLISSLSPTLMPITLNETSIDRMLIQFLERCVKLGKTAPPRHPRDFMEINSPFNLRTKLIPSLQRNEKFIGFNSTLGANILEGWISTSLLEIIPQGKKKSSALQIDYVRLLTVANYRSGLPSSNSRARHRNVDLVTYRVLHNYLKKEGAARPTWEIHDTVVNCSLAVGVPFAEIDVSNTWSDPKYDESTEVDINTLLELRLLAEFPAVNSTRNSSDKNSEVPIELPINEPFEILAKDFYNCTKNYANYSPNELLKFYRSIFSIRLYQLPIRVGRRLQLELDAQSSELASTSNCPDADMFFDFTNDPNSSSSKLSNETVLRDLHLLNEYFDNSILIREAERCLLAVQDLAKEYKALSPAESLTFLVKNLNDERIQIAAGLKLQSIKDFLADDEDQLAVVDQVVETSRNQLYALTELILMDRRTEGLSGFKKWLSDVGGIRQQTLLDNVSIIKGNKKYPHLWVYGMSDTVLNALLHMCFLNDRNTLERRNSLEMKEILRRLRERFGVLINEAPINFDSPEHFKAASENYLAFTKRLKNLGWFENLSDDFDAQYVTRPKGVRI